MNIRPEIKPELAEKLQATKPTSMSLTTYINWIIEKYFRGNK